MASKTTASPSRIPVPVRSPAASSPVSACYSVREISSDTSVVTRCTDTRLHAANENGVLADSSKSQIVSPQSSKGKGFETFLMTGDMIIRTTPPHQKSRGSEDGSPQSQTNSRKEDVHRETSTQKVEMYAIESSPSLQRHVVQTAPEGSKFSSIPKAPVASFEELSDMSQSSSSGEFFENNKTIQTVSSDTSSLVADTFGLDQALETLGKLGSSLPGSECNSADSTMQEAPSSSDSGVLQDSNSSDSDTAERKMPSDKDGVHRVMTTSMSDEKIMTNASKNDGSRPLVRTSKSHENYLQSDGGMALVPIDIDDNMAYSLDTLTYHDSNSDSSSEKVSEFNHQSRSLHSSPEKKTEHGVSEREFIPGFISLEDSKPPKSTLPKHFEDSGVFIKTEIGDGEHTDLNLSCSQKLDNESGEAVVFNESDIDIMQMSIRSDDSDAESLYHQPAKGVDQPSAARLAKRLFHLEGFRKSDVSRHLCKK